ncbi:uncharacterized protein At4g13200, chloroplastic-like isoform X2 [Salvia hispanica]|uniref:uncharacterized protein At4g13200, chloroplastic-like isoform X2 n=1 Tax=Salvia hispanica TaxID=49212 RepID=UPI002009A210|nr:uncharacterized protein At4g13200, chloroplastic-like isoform X2 [Salvia hispanica]
MACPKTYTAAFPASINRGLFVVPPAHASIPNSNSFRSLQTSRLDLLRCNTSGESGCKMLDAFFLGKVIGEILYERIESSVGEFVGVIGRLQSDQLKHVTQFQEEVLEKTKRAKEEAMGLGLASTVKETAEEVISEAAQQVTDEALGLISEAAEQVTEEAQGIISSVTPSVISKASSLLLDRATQNPFNKD